MTLAHGFVAVIIAASVAYFAGYNRAADKYEAAISKSNYETLEQKAEIVKSLSTKITEANDEAERKTGELEKHYLNIIDNLNGRVRNTASNGKALRGNAAGAAKADAESTDRHNAENIRDLKRALIDLAYRCDVNATNQNALIDIMESAHGHGD